MPKRVATHFVNELREIANWRSAHAPTFWFLWVGGWGELIAFQLLRVANLFPPKLEIKTQLIESIFSGRKISGQDSCNTEHGQSAVIQFHVSHFWAVHTKAQWVPKISWLLFGVLFPGGELKNTTNCDQRSKTPCACGCDTIRRILETRKFYEMLRDSTHCTQHRNTAVLQFRCAILHECWSVAWWTESKWIEIV